MTSANWLVIMVALTVAIVSAPAMALPDWAFSDDFEGVTGASLPSGADLNPDTSIWDMAQFWEQSDTTLLQVGNNAGIAHSGTNYLSIKKYSNSSRGWYFLERWWDGNLDGSYPQHNISACQENFEWKMSVRLADVQNGIRLYVGSHSPYPSLNTQQALGVGVSGGYLTRFYRDNAVSTGQAILPNTWYDIKVVADWPTETFDLYLNNSLVGNYVFNNTWTGSVIRSMHIIADSDGALLDDISFVPEPATMALLALGLPLLRRRK
jgi:hypothetical protein